MFIAITFAGVLLPYQANAPLSAHMTWQGFTPAAFGAVLSVNGILIIALQPAISTWSSRRRPTRVLVAAAAFYGVGLAMHGLATTAVMHGIAVMVWAIGEILESPVRASVVAAMAPADARGRYRCGRRASGSAPSWRSR